MSLVGRGRARADKGQAMRSLSRDGWCGSVERVEIGTSRDKERRRLGRKTTRRRKEDTTRWLLMRGRSHQACCNVPCTLRAACGTPLAPSGQGFQHVWRCWPAQSLYGRITKLPPSAGY